MMSGFVFQLPSVRILHRNYEVSQRCQQAHVNLKRKKDGAVELRNDSAQILQDYETNRSILTTKVQRLYEQNDHKMKRTLLKLQEEVRLLNGMVAEGRDAVQGLCCLIAIANSMNEYLQDFLIYQQFVDNAARATEKFDSFSDIITNYNSLMSIYNKSSDLFNRLMRDVETSTTNLLSTKREMTSHLNFLICELNKVQNQTVEQEKILNLKMETLAQVKLNGSEISIEAVKTNLHKCNIFQQLIKTKEVDKSILKKKFSLQINVIRDNLLTLKRITDFK